MQSQPKILLPIINGKISTEETPEELLDYVTHEEYNERIQAFNKLKSMHRQRSCLICFGPYICTLISIAIIVSLVFLYKNTPHPSLAGSEKLADWAMFGAITLIGLVSFIWALTWKLVIRNKARNQIHDLIKNFNKEDINTIGIEWIYEPLGRKVIEGEKSTISSYTQYYSKPQEFLVIKLFNNDFRGSTNDLLSYSQLQGSFSTIVLIPDEEEEKNKSLDSIKSAEIKG
ncbi:hypothetical protein G9A89_005673 [Geosiphon pyriformis]|nr:hypothetical protein G9A89_005673 [Geosiphon pyriformis]